LAKPKGKITPAKTQIENPNFHSSFHIEQKITKTHQSLGPNNLKNQFIPSTETKIQTLTKKKKKNLTVRSKNNKNPQIIETQEA
jgi:hypothetical protein